MDRTVDPAQDTQLHRVLSDWGEGTSGAGGDPLHMGGGGGSPATAGDATWLHTFFDTSFWANPGGDFSSTASAARSVDQPGFYT